MTDRVGNRDRRARFDHHPDQSLAQAHRDLADRVAVEPDGRAQHQALALRIEQVERADLGLHPFGDRGDDPIERGAQIFVVFTANRGDFLDQRKAISIGCH